MEMAGDFAGNRRAIDETVRGADDVPRARALVYEYDERYQLTSESWEGHDYEYEYDRAGNRTAMTTTKATTEGTEVTDHSANQN